MGYDLSNEKQDRFQPIGRKNVQFSDAGRRTIGHPSLVYSGNDSLANPFDLAQDI
jgi:hypothetical protein